MRDITTGALIMGRAAAPDVVVVIIIIATTMPITPTRLMTPLSICRPVKHTTPDSLMAGTVGSYRGTQDQMGDQISAFRCPDATYDGYDVTASTDEVARLGGGLVSPNPWTRLFALPPC